MSTLTKGPSVSVTSSPPGALSGWLEQIEPEWFRYGFAPDAKLQAGELLRRVGNIFESRGRSRFITVHIENEWLGFAAISELQWDSGHFGFPVLRVAPLCIRSNLDREVSGVVLTALLDTSMELAGEMNAGLVQRRLLSSRREEIHVLESAGFHLADNLVIMTARPNASGTARTDVSLRTIRDDDREPLHSMLVAGFPYSRFFWEEKLVRNNGKSVYQGWLDDSLDKALRGDHPFIVAVDSASEQPVGFLSWDLDTAYREVTGTPLAEMELFVTAPEHRGRGIGQALINELFRQTRERQVELVEASTWINEKGAMMAYQKAGFMVRENIFTYHHVMGSGS